MTAVENEQNGLRRTRATTHFERGRHLFNANRFEEALAAIDEALTEDPEFLRAYTAKANALTMLGRAQEAVAICDEVLKKDPDFALAYTTRASALHRAGRRDEALDDYRRGVELAPTEHLTHYNFACFWALEGDEAECEKYLRRALEIDPRAKPKAATDADFASVRGEEWFQELIAL
jgi:tetratricopeptide (TPR) repeat protein